LGTRASHREDERVLALLRRHALRLAQTFELPLRALHAESRRVRRRYGVCYEDGTIKIRLRSVRNGELLRESSLVDTLCHELAHLRHFDHGLRFERLYRRILEYARRHDIYRPGHPSRWQVPDAVTQGAERLVPSVLPQRCPAAPVSARPPAPVQLELF
jgi:predicted metal-dependent hydrolase